MTLEQTNTIPENMLSVPVELDPTVRDGFLASANDLLNRYGNVAKSKNLDGTVEKIRFIGATDPESHDTMHVARMPDGSVDVILGTALQPQKGKPDWFSHYTFDKDGGTTYSGTHNSPTGVKSLESFGVFNESFSKIATYASRIGRAKSLGRRILTGSIFKER